MNPLSDLVELEGDGASVGIFGHEHQVDDADGVAVDELGEGGDPPVFEASTRNSMMTYSTGPIWVLLSERATTRIFGRSVTLVANAGAPRGNWRTVTKIPDPLGTAEELLHGDCGRSWCGRRRIDTSGRGRVRRATS